MPGSGKTGFFAEDGKRHRKLSSKGGKSAHAQGKAHEFDAAQASTAGLKGQAKLRAKYGAGYAEHMASIGRKGGAVVSADKKHMAAIGRKGGEVTKEEVSNG